MNELTDLDEITNLRPDSPLPAAADLAGARARLLGAFERPVRRGRRGLVWGGIGVAAVAAAVAVVAPPTHPTSTAPAVPTGPPVRVLDAADVLHDAAAAALHEPDVVPRPDQFVYTRFVDGTEVWRSADGTRDGLERPAPRSPSMVLPGCRDGRMAVLDKKDWQITGQTVPCTPEPAYNPTLPADPNALIKLYNDGMPFDPNQPTDVNRVAKGVLAAVDTSFLRPVVRAALFNALSQIPGLSVDQHAVDVLGRPGIGVSWSYSGSVELVFDAKTYQFLGGKVTTPSGDTGSAAVVQLAIVDRAGQLPAS